MVEAGGGRLTTHVLDLRLGAPARGLAFSLDRIEGDRRIRVCDGRTDDDGRTSRPLLQAADMKVGTYEIVFSAGEYQARQSPSGDPGFYDLVPVRFTIAVATAHYHVPLLLSPFGYSTYRGS